MNDLIIKFMRSLKGDEKKKYFCSEPSEKTIGVPIPSPRTWEIVSNVLDLNVDELTMFEMIKGAVGEETATKFIKFKHEEQGCSLQYLLSDKPVSLISLSDSNISKLCSEMRVLIDNDFKDYNINDIFMKVGDFIAYISESPDKVAILFNTDTVLNKPKLKLIFEKYNDHMNINLLDKILEVIL